MQKYCPEDSLFEWSQKRISSTWLHNQFYHHYFAKLTKQYTYTALDILCDGLENLNLPRSAVICP